MTENPWPQEVKDFYSNLSLEEGPLESIAQLHNAGLQVRRWKRIAAGFAAACAVLMVASAVVVSRAGKRNDFANPNVVDNQPVAVDEDAPPATDTENTEAGAADNQRPSYDLIAVRLHKDYCYRCKQMGNVFAEIQQDLDGRGILFVTYDLTDEVTAKQSLLLGEILRIKPPLADLETGNIALLTPDGEFIELLDGTSGRENLTSQIAMRL